MSSFLSPPSHQSIFFLSLILVHPLQLARLYEKFEKELVLLGATAVEDKLQENVPETIQTLYESGTSIWVLTGDMQNTAINVAYSCNLLNNEMQQFVLGHENEDAVRGAIAEYEELINKSPERAAALIIHGRSLLHTVDTPLEEAFFHFVSRCKIVICCRVTPLQKCKFFFLFLFLFLFLSFFLLLSLD